MTRMSFGSTAYVVCSYFCTKYVKIQICPFLRCIAHTQSHPATNICTYSVGGALCDCQWVLVDLPYLQIEMIGEDATKLQQRYPENSVQIAAKQAEIVGLWEALKLKASKRKAQLNDSHKFQKFLGDHR